MGTIAARDALRILELCEQVAAANLIATVQALRLRLRERHLTAALIGPRLNAFLGDLGRIVPALDRDIPLDVTLDGLITAIRTRTFALPEDAQ